MVRARKRITWTGRLLIFAASVNLVLAAVMAVVLAAAWREPPRLDTEVPAYYRPGQTMTRSRSCSWDRDSWETTVSCTERGMSGLRYFVSYSAVRGTIVRTAKWTAYDNIRLGDLIVAWGQPSSVGSGFLSWGNRSAHAVSRTGMSPFDKVYLISYTLDPVERDRWRGFINREPYRIARELSRLFR
jgi:hypothetical protein